MAFAFLPVCPCSPCLGRTLYFWHLFPFAWASVLLFRSCARILVAFSDFGFLRASSSVTASCPPSASALYLFFSSFVTRSNRSSFATGSSLWAESALSAVVFMSVSCLGLLSPIVLRPLPVLVVYVFLFMGGCSFFGVPLPLFFSSLGVYAFLCVAGFPYCALSPFKVFGGLYYSCRCGCVLMFRWGCCMLLLYFAFFYIVFLQLEESFW